MKIKYETAKKPYIFTWKIGNEEGETLPHKPYLLYQEGTFEAKNYKEAVDFMCRLDNKKIELKIIKKIKDNYFIVYELDDGLFSNFTIDNCRIGANEKYKNLYSSQEEFNIAKEFLANISDNFTKTDFAPIIEVQGEELEKMQEEIYKAIFAELLLFSPDDGISKLIIDEEVIIDYVDKNDCIKLIYNDKFSKNIREKTFNQMKFGPVTLGMDKKHSLFYFFDDSTTYINNNAKEEPKRHKTLF